MAGVTGGVTGSTGDGSGVPGDKVKEGPEGTNDVTSGGKNDMFIGGVFLAGINLGNSLLLILGAHIAKSGDIPSATV